MIPHCQLFDDPRRGSRGPGPREENMNPAHAASRTFDVLFVGYGDWHLWSWDGFRTRSAQICMFLASSPAVRRVFVLNEPVYLTRLNPGFALPPLKRFRTLPLRSSYRRVDEKLGLLDPSRFLVGPERLKRPFILHMVRRESARHLDGERLVLWLANLHKAYLLEALPAALRVFDAIDDWEAISGHQRHGDRVRQGYRLVFERADLVYTVSRHLEQRFRERARTSHVRHLPNGVDLSVFDRPAPPPEERRARGASSPPLLTYVGMLTERFDIDLVERLARERPEYRIRLVGPMSRVIEDRWRTVGALPNVEWTGLVHHGRVPGILASSDILLIPHRVTPLSLSMDPLKLYEYLTTGLPIVSTPVPPMENYPGLVYVGEGPEFVRRVDEALGEARRPEGGELWRARIEESKRHGWEARVERITSDLLALLGRRGKGSPEDGGRGGEKDPPAGP